MIARQVQAQVLMMMILDLKNKKYVATLFIYIPYWKFQFVSFVLKISNRSNDDKDYHRYLMIIVMIIIKTTTKTTTSNKISSSSKTLWHVADVGGPKMILMMKNYFSVTIVRELSVKNV